MSYDEAEARMVAAEAKVSQLEVELAGMRDKLPCITFGEWPPATATPSPITKDTPGVILLPWFGSVEGTGHYYREGGVECYIEDGVTQWCDEAGDE